MAFLLYFAVVFYGMNVARSVVAEKTSRVFEVLLATAKPESLMAGKLLGVGAVGLTQLGIWIGALLLLSVSALAQPTGPGRPGGLRHLADQAGLLRHLFPAGIFLL